MDARALSILGVDPERGFAGGESQVLGLTLALIRAGHRAALICHPDGILRHRGQAAGVDCYPLRIRNSIDLAAGLKLRDFLKRKNYDIVHFHTARAHALAPFVRRCASALVVTRRMDYPPNRFFAPFLFNRAVDGVAAISPAVADALVQSGVTRDRIAIIPSGVDCARFHPPDAAEREAARAELGLTTAEVAVGTVGMLELRKGQRYLIDAIARLRRDAHVASVECFIAGSGRLAAELAAQIREYRLDDSVRLIGVIDDPRRLLGALDIFAMPSLQEGLGVAALEAMACGLPVVASATGGLAQLVEDGITGIQVPPADERALAEAIARLSAEPSLRATMGSAGRTRVCASYSMEAMAKKTLELYRACLHNRAQSRR
ncbi:MAG TPA: glycosyltransferase family 4 protein [Candidatus Binataceae bacterium]|nr:glycosyltransferase family 4 protein [Candidatus Binataceae bacterium]